MNLKNIKKEWVYWLVIIILAFLLLRGCGNSTTDCPEPTIKITTKDSVVYVKGETDTIYFEKMYSIKNIKPTKVDAIQEFEDTPISTFVYQTLVEDTLIKGEIISRVSNNKLTGSDFNYTPKFPKYITRVDTIKDFKTTIIEKTIVKNKWEVYVGAVVGGSKTNFVLTPTLLIRTTKNLSVSAGYDLINQTYNIGVYTKLFNKK
jgi:hypothetical protein